MGGNLYKIDWILVVAVLILSGISLLLLYSISTTDADKGMSSVFHKQLIFFIFGIVLMALFSKINYHYLLSYGSIIYFLTLILLVIVLIWGNVVRGTSGWIGIGPFQIQPVEIAKLSLIIFLASFISQKKMEIGETGRLVISLVLISLMVVLVLKQPDFGSAMVLAGIWAGMVIASGISRKIFITLLLSLFLFMLVAWTFLADYQKERIENFISPYNDPQGSGYNVIQSLIAIGSGGIAGKGLGYGSQSHLNFLPEKHNDFIFAVLVEELGLVGAAILLFIFLMIFYRIKVISQKASDNFGYLMASGIFVMFLVQVGVNVGMNVGLFPVAGISLPFVSYGGSFLIAVYISIGILLNIYSHREDLANLRRTAYND